MDVKRLFHGLRPYFCDLSGRRHVMDQKLDKIRRFSRPAARLIPAASLLFVGLLSACAGEMELGKSETVADNKPATTLHLAGFKPAKSLTGSYLAGRSAQKAHDYDRANEYLSHALDADQANANLLRRTFLVSLAGGQMDHAVGIAKQIVNKKDSGALLANVVLVVADIKANRLEAAKAKLKNIKRRGLSTFLTPMLRGWIIAGLGDSDGAIKALKPLRAISGFSVLHDLHAGLINDYSGRADLAEKNLKQASKRTRRSTLRIVQALGSIYERTGRVDRAKTLYVEYMSQNPQSRVLLPALNRIRKNDPAPKLVDGVRAGAAEAFFNVASTLTQENAVEMALIYGRLALDLRPDLALATMLVGGILESLGRHEPAIEVYGSVAPDSPLWWSARLRMASSLNAMGRDEEAIKQLRNMAGEKTSRPEALVNLADLLRSKKRFSESVEAYDAAIKRIGTIGKRHWTLLYSRGIALERSQQWKRAEDDFITALRLKPDQPYVLNYLGYSWVDQGINLARAQKMIERAVELRPNDGYIVDSLGWVLFRLGDFPRAARQLERAVELRPQDPTINDHLGDAYWRVGRAVEARFQWRRALSLDPDPDQASAIQDKISNGLSASLSKKGS
jgi:tetratricopeptide (TPR) repeat protein